jgi:hypothetical protein
MQIEYTRPVGDGTNFKAVFIQDRPEDACRLTLYHQINGEWLMVGGGVVDGNTAEFINPIEEIIAAALSICEMAFHKFNAGVKVPDVKFN